MRRMSASDLAPPLNRTGGEPESRDPLSTSTLRIATKASAEPSLRNRSTSGGGTDGLGKQGGSRGSAVPSSSKDGTAEPADLLSSSAGVGGVDGSPVMVGGEFGSPVAKLGGADQGIDRINVQGDNEYSRMNQDLTVDVGYPQVRRRSDSSGGGGVVFA